MANTINAIIPTIFDLNMFSFPPSDFDLVGMDEKLVKSRKIPLALQKSPKGKQESPWSHCIGTFLWLPMIPIENA
jgi:hypothetical protein